MKKHIPNILTACNLACGCISLALITQYEFKWAVYFVLFAAVFDFFDGFVARLLKVSSEIGKQLDSLCDVVTFGVVPGFLLFIYLTEFNFLLLDGREKWIYAIAFLVPILSAFRLAKFNIDEAQTKEFIGVPTPANAIFICGMVLYLEFNEGASMESINHLVLLVLSLAMSFMLVLPIRMFSFKFVGYSWKTNEVKFIFLGLVVLTFIGCLLINKPSLTLPLIILLYPIVSIINNLTTKSK